MSRCYPQILNRAMEAFESSRFAAYLIGPRARDIAREESIQDARSFDLTIDAPLSSIECVMQETFGVVPQESREEHPKILTFKVPHPDLPTEIVTLNVGTFRNYLPPLRSLRNQNLSGIILDLATREVTIQAFAYDHAGVLIDPFGGTLDYQQGLIRPVFPVETIFRESASWLLKIARYVARYGFEPAREVRTMADRDASNILDVPREIVFRELDKTLCGTFAPRGLQFLYEVRVLGFLLPEVVQLVSFSKGAGGRHKDIWEHTKQVVANAEPTSVVRWAALCHDIGKVWTRQIFRDEKVHFFRHEDMSAYLFEGICARLHIPSEFASRVHYLVKNHSRINLYRQDWTDSAVRRLIKETGEHLEDLIAFSKADMTSKRAERVEMIRSLLTELQIRILEVRETDAIKSPLPKGIGTLIMERFLVKPGPEVGALRNLLLEAVEAGALNEAPTPEQCIEFLKNTRKETSPKILRQSRHTRNGYRQ